MKELPPYRKALRFLRCMGVKATLQKIKQRIRTSRILETVQIPPYTPADITAQRRNKLQKAGKLYIFVDVHGTNEEYIRALVDSVLSQTYEDWILCLNGCDEAVAPQHERIIATKQFAMRDFPSDTVFVAWLASGCLLHECALFEVVHSMVAEDAELVYTDELNENGVPLYKPDFSPDLLRSTNYIGCFWAAKKAIVEHAGGVGNQTFDLILRLTEQARKIAHVQRILCERTKPVAYDPDGDMVALTEHLERCKLCATVETGCVQGTYRICYTIERLCLVSILIPNKDHAEDLLRCIGSLKEKTTYPNWEIIIIENNSTDPETFACYDKLKTDERIKVVIWKESFNYAAINNYGETFARGEYLLLLNNDMEIITPSWIEEMLMLAQRQDVGAVGTMLYFPDDTVQHGGVIVGLYGVADHAHKHYRRGVSGYMNRLAIVQNFSAVTAACLMIRRSVYHEVGGFDTAFQVAFNDVDLCMRIRAAGYLIAWTPYAELYHWESKSRGLDETPERYLRFAGEVERFQNRWMSQLLKGDPYYNRNLTQERNDFGI